MDCIYLLATALRDIGLKQKKAEALYLTYKRGLAEGRFKNMYEASLWCAKQPAPSYFISSKRASLLLGLIFSDTSLINLRPHLRRLVWRLHDEYMEYLKQHPDNKLSRERILEIIVEQPAPEFYVSGERARKMLREQIHKARKRLGWYD